jgi:hypothetical protein
MMIIGSMAFVAAAISAVAALLLPSQSTKFIALTIWGISMLVFVYCVQTSIYGAH